MQTLEKRAKRLDLLKKYYNADYNVHKKNNPNKSNNNEDGWVILKIASLSDQTTVVHESLSTTDENITMTATNDDGLMERVNTTKSVTKSVKTMTYALNDAKASELLIIMIRKESNHLACSVKNFYEKEIC